MKKSFALISLMLLSGCATPAEAPIEVEITPQEEVVALEESASEVMVEEIKEMLRVKYRADEVNVLTKKFEKVDTTGSSVIRNAWYDASEKYLVIGVSEKFYHYCGVDAATWESFKTAESFGRAYNSLFKNKFSCEGLSVPTYK